MNDEKISDVCRVCLCTGSDNRSLFTKYKNSFIYDHINNVTNIQIKLGDGLPDKICSTCYLELEIVVNFKEKCESSNYRLLSKSYGKSTQVTSEFIIKKEEDVTEYLTDDHWNEEFNISADFHSCDSTNESAHPVAETNKKDALYPEVQCHDCGDFFKSKYKLMIHWKKEHLLKAHKMIDNSTDCHRNEKFSISTDFRVSDSIKDSTPIAAKVQCHDCGEYFKSKCKLRVHWKKTHMLKSFVCHLCKRMFKSCKAYNTHLKKKARSCTFVASGMVNIVGIGQARIFHCKECSFKTSRIKDIQTHLVIHSGDRPFQCELCPKTFTQLSSLQMHKESAHKQYKLEITCHFCGRIVKGRFKAFRHLKTHTEIKTPCSICNVMLSKDSLKTHMKRHSGIKSYVCEKCPSSFFSSAELCNHRREVHEKRRKVYECGLCEYKSTRSDKIKVHKMKHAFSNIPCTTCGMFLLSKEKLIKHQRLHYEEKKYSCPHCDVKFHIRDSIHRHIRNKHKCLISDDCKPGPVAVKEEISDVKPHKTKVIDTSNIKIQYV